MLSHRSSRTAEGATLIRLLQQQLPQQQRVLHDPWVSSIGLLAHRWLAQVPFFAQFCLKVLPRMVDYVPVRDRFADEVVDQALTRGVRQVVVLGAGLDTIAYRVLAKHPHATIYEVDHPNTQQVKRRRVRHLADQHGHNVRYVAADFEKDDFRTSLQASGFRADQDGGAVLPHRRSRAADAYESPCLDDMRLNAGV
jgi:methyltransferase (TIGR00027 family)